MAKPSICRPLTLAAELQMAGWERISVSQGVFGMRHSRLFTALLLSLLTVLLAGSALADSNVTLTLMSTGSNNGGGAYTYPYNFSINGSQSITPLICDSYDNEVILGEHWTATPNSFLSGKGLFGSNPNYLAAGLIFQDILAGHVSATEGNWAIWGLFSSNARNNPYFASSGAAGLDTTYLLEAAWAPSSDFDGLVLYTPVAGTQSWGGTPQEYIGCVSMPEPAELSLILTTLMLGLATIVMGKRLGLKPVVKLGR
jgi:hypothetical protein